MVHALQKIRRLLRPGGVLVDIHPVSEPSLVKVIRDRQILFSEPKRQDLHEGVQQADRAISDVITSELFTSERHSIFDFYSYGSSAQELRDFWDDYNEYEDEPIDEAKKTYQDQVFGQAQEILAASGENAKIAIHERAQVARMIPNRRE